MSFISRFFSIKSVVLFLYLSNPVWGLTKCLARDTEDQKYRLLDHNRSFVSQVTDRDTYYEIKDNYDLKGAEVVIPNGCVLFFNGGSISNGLIRFNDCAITAGPYTIFSYSLRVSGRFTAQEYLPEWFGAKGDSNNDDSDAIQKLINCGLPVHLGPKTYKIKKTLNVISGTSIQGVGYNSIIEAEGCSAISAKQSFTGVFISNLRLLGDYSKNNSGILFENAMPKMVIDNIHISQFGSFGIYVKKAWDYSIRNVNVSANENGLFAESFNSSLLDKVVAYRNKKYGVIIESAANAHISGTLQENGFTGLLLKACFSCDVSVYGEQNGYHGLINEESAEIVVTSGGSQNDTSVLNTIQFYLNGGKGSEMEGKYGLYLNWASKNLISGMSVRHTISDIYETSNSSKNIISDVAANSRNTLTTKNSILTK